jgi:hypothetical protein
LPPSLAADGQALGPRGCHEWRAARRDPARELARARRAARPLALALVTVDLNHVNATDASDATDPTIATGATIACCAGCHRIELRSLRDCSDGSMQARILRRRFRMSAGGAQKYR